MDWITPQIAIGHVHDAVHLDPAVDAVVCLKPGCRCGEVGPAGRSTRGAPGRRAGNWSDSVHRNAVGDPPGFGREDPQ